MFKRRVSVFDVSSAFISPTGLLSAYQLEWNPTAFPAAGEKRQAFTKPDMAYVSSVVQAARGRKSGFRFFLARVGRRLSLDQRQTERYVSMFGPNQKYYKDEFLFVKSYLTPVNTTAFVQFCEAFVGLQF